jgi:hypothetical protein
MMTPSKYYSRITSHKNKSVVEKTSRPEFNRSYLAPTYNQKNTPKKTQQQQINAPVFFSQVSNNNNNKKKAKKNAAFRCGQVQILMVT